MLFDEVNRERVVPGGHRRMRREHRRRTDLVERLLEGRALLDEIADPLQDDEGRVPFVQMKDQGIRPERLQRPDAPDAEDDLLLNARFTIAAVEPRREFAVPGYVFFEVGIEQIE